MNNTLEEFNRAYSEKEQWAREMGIYGFAEKLEHERDALREENGRLIELLRRDEKPIWMDGARSGTETGIDMAIKCLESLRESILEQLKEEVK